MLDAVRGELRAAGRLDSACGQLAVLLAERMCGPGESGSAVAALSKELSRVMVEAVGAVPEPGDPLDELQELRNRKRAACP